MAVLLKTNVLLAVFFHLASSTKPASKAVPVFILDDNNVLNDVKLHSNPFSRVHKDEFELIVRKALTKAAKIIVFVENSISTEDLATQDSKGSPFQKLRSGLKRGIVKYHPAVIAPYETLINLIKQNPQNTYSLTRLSITSNPDYINRQVKSIYVIFIDDAHESRIDTLRRHDTQVMDTFKYVRQTTLGNVVAFFTGKVNSVPPLTTLSLPKMLKNVTEGIKLSDKFKQQTIHEVGTTNNESRNDPDLIKETTKLTTSKEKMKGFVEETTKEPSISDKTKDFLEETRKPTSYLLITSPGVKYRLKDVYKVTYTRPTKFTRYDRTDHTATEALTDSELNSAITFGDFDLLFSFSFTPRVWRLSSISLVHNNEEVGITMLGIQANWNCSYLCFEPITITNYKDGSLVTISEYQIEPRYSIYETATRYGREDPQSVSTLLAKEGIEQDTSDDFNPPEHCGVFFTSAILSATVVIATMVFITSSGIIAMFDLRTNNKYDDVNVTKRLVIIEN